MKQLLLAALLASAAIGVQATEISIDGMTIKSGSTTIRFGDQDKRGYYWDGKVWRDPDYWHKHHGKGVGKDCPPGQAKKGRC
ncbi:DUF2502 domain-containing protein [Chitinibacter sp. SCUT-21]|uniref:DUF2502 domain-containing protein n=1 Tax=Chitinibacter sp. SCUT-21 TaxID=2970891 RepID=UPI0035A6F00F